ncbi:MAG: hypothetical protein P4N59_24235 [Negativicutes bacterium]|nr:hypothetical protein [Negativicutes bacterium]
MTSDKEAELRRLVSERPLASNPELAEVMKLSTATVQRWSKKLELPRPEYARKMTPEKQAQLRTLVENNPLANYRELSEALQISCSTIHYWIGRLGIPAPYQGFKGKTTPEKDALLRSLAAKTPRKTFQEMAEALGIDKTTVFKWAKRLGIPHHVARRKITSDNMDLLRRLVTEKPLASFNELAGVMRLSSTTVRYWIKRLGLPHHDGRK